MSRCNSNHSLSSLGWNCTYQQIHLQPCWPGSSGELTLWPCPLSGSPCLSRAFSQVLADSLKHNVLVQIMPFQKMACFVWTVAVKMLQELLSQCFFWVRSIPGPGPALLSPPQVMTRGKSGPLIWIWYDPCYATRPTMLICCGSPPCSSVLKPGRYIRSIKGNAQNVNSPFPLLTPALSRWACGLWHSWRKSNPYILLVCEGRVVVRIRDEKRDRISATARQTSGEMEGDVNAAVSIISPT